MCPGHSVGPETVWDSSLSENDRLKFGFDSGFDSDFGFDSDCHSLMALLQE